MQTTSKLNCLEYRHDLCGKIGKCSISLRIIIVLYDIVSVHFILYIKARSVYSISRLSRYTYNRSLYISPIDLI